MVKREANQPSAPTQGALNTVQGAALLVTSSQFVEQQKYLGLLIFPSHTLLTLKASSLFSWFDIVIFHFSCWQSLGTLCFLMFSLLGLGESGQAFSFFYFYKAFLDLGSGKDTIFQLILVFDLAGECLHGIAFVLAAVPSKRFLKVWFINLDILFQR